MKEAAEALYTSMSAAGLDVLFDDRDDRVGVMLADQELMGIPVRVVVGDRGLKEGLVEVQGRRMEAAEKIPAADVLKRVQTLLEQAP